MKKFITVLSVSLVMLLISSCQKDHKDEPKKEMIGQKAETAITIDSLAVADAWIRPGVKGSNSALFFEIINGTEFPDTIYAAKSDLAAIVEVHESYQESGDKMGMRHVDFVEVSAKNRFLFKPRSFHVMLIILKQDLKQDATHEVSLFFKRRGEVKVRAVVQDRMTSQMKEGTKGH
ncbi:MAG: copper chaperone PCu(A)C [bacterium]